MIWQVGEAGTNQAKERISGEMLASLRGNDRHGNPRLENLKSFQGEGYCRIDVYEKATGISRWLLGFVALRELLHTIQSCAAVVAMYTRLPFNKLCFSSATRSLGNRSGLLTVVPTTLKRPKP